MMRLVSRIIVASFLMVGPSATSLRGQKHRPSVPTDLATYKDSVGECLTWCSGGKATCFQGCVGDCAVNLGPPPCAAFALEVPCFKACGTLELAFGCLHSVDANSTDVCHSKLANITLPEKECPMP
eukprot:TRINITY_DN62943_c0_g1_i1.p1 TRINITY_DN62943_c0_g1~~TRINITY_DN62943_c0_g1_i1.p1  ORF type:complete len:126 (+),score=26.55 TRINITY_DN62943_c0_g1_i1:70-447(+)